MSQCLRRRNTKNRGNSRPNGRAPAERMVAGWESRGDMNRALLVLFAAGVAVALGTYWAYVSAEHGKDGRDAIYSACMKRRIFAPSRATAGFRGSAK